MGLSLFMAMAACQPAPPEFPEVPRGVVAVGVALRAFRDICVDTAPGFQQARDRFAASGLVEPRDGVVYDASGTLSVNIAEIQTRRGSFVRCSIVYTDPNRYIAREKVDVMVENLGDRLSAPRKAHFPTAEGGARESRGWSFAAGDRMGEFFDVPHAGGANLGVLILQFPID